MKHTRKITAFLLCAAMAFTPVISPVYAVDTDEPETARTEETVEETPVPTVGRPSEQMTFYITKLPDKLHYQIGEALDLTGGTAFAGGQYDDGSGNVMCWDDFDQPMTYYTVDASEFNNTRPGTYKIYLTCKGQLESKTVSFEVRVEGDPVETVAPTTLPQTTGSMTFCVHNPTKRFYKLGDDLDLTGGYAWLANEDNYEAVTPKKPLFDQQYTIDASEFDNGKPGVYTIRVHYGIYEHEFTVYVMNADGTMPDGLPMPTGTDNPYTPTNSTAPTGIDNPYDTQETTQALDRLGKNDINGDGTTDIMDVIVLNKHLLGVRQMSGLERTFADVNWDGVIDSADSIALLKKALGVPEEDDPVEPSTVPTQEPTTEFVDPTGNCKIPPEEPTQPTTLREEPTDLPAPTETTQPTTGLDSGIAPVKYSEHFYGAKVERGTVSDGYQSSIDVLTDAYNSLIGLYGYKFYEDNNLIIIGQTESSGSYRLTVKDVTVDEDGIYTVHIERYKPFVATCDLARWYIYVATDKGVTDAEHVKVEFTDVMEETRELM